MWLIGGVLSAAASGLAIQRYSDQEHRLEALAF